MTWVMIAFFVLLAVGVGFGIVRDVASTEEGVIDGTVVGNTAPGSAYRWPTSPPSIKVKLASGAVESVYTRGGAEPPVGATVAVRQLRAPWGPLWYKLKD
jgi:hypothetical protein